MDESLFAEPKLPRYRDMMRRLARDPVGQTRVFELMMRLFFIHVLGVRPDCLRNRRRQVRAPREWCTDGVASSASAPGIFGPVHAFRGEIEAQGRGSLHPHILVWLVNISSLELLRILRRDPACFKQRLATWMRTVVQAVQTTSQASVKSLPRQFGDATLHCLIYRSRGPSALFAVTTEEVNWKLFGQKKSAVSKYQKKCSGC